MKFNKVIFTLLSMVTLLTTITSCSEAGADQKTPATIIKGDLTLVPLKEAIVVSDYSYAHFKAYIGEEDVTKNTSLTIYYVDENGKESKTSIKHKINQVKEYQFYATCNNGSEKIESEMVKVWGIENEELTLAAPSMVAVGNSFNLGLYFGGSVVEASNPNVKLTVTHNGTESQITDSNFTIEEAGDYSFSATYTQQNDEFESEVVTVEGVEWQGGEFHRTLLGIQATGAWCQFCPTIIAGIRRYEEKYQHDNLIFAAAHNGDIMANRLSSLIISKMNITGFPALIIGSFSSIYGEDINGSTSSSLVTLSGITKAEANLLKTKANTGLALSAELKDDKISMEGTILVGNSGSYAIGAMVLEDGIYARQTAFTSSANLEKALGITVEDASTHHNIIQGLYNKVAYEALGGTASQEAHTGYKVNYDFLLEDMPTLSEAENCSVILYTYNTETNMFDNVVKVAVGESCDVRYE